MMNWTKLSMVGQPSNLLLAALNPSYRAALLARMRTVTLAPREILYEADEPPKYAHFLTSGVASILVSMANGASTEVGIWGREGLVESFHLLGGARIPNRCIVHMESTALRMPFKELHKEFQENTGAARLRAAGRAEPMRNSGSTGGLQPAARGRGTAGALVADGARPNGEQHLPPDPGISCRHVGSAPYNGHGGGRRVAEKGADPVQPRTHSTKGSSGAGERGLRVLCHNSRSLRELLLWRA